MPGCGGGGSGATALESTAVDGSEGGSIDTGDIGDGAVMPPVGINAPMLTDYDSKTLQLVPGTRSTYWNVLGLKTLKKSENDRIMNL